MVLSCLSVDLAESTETLARLAERPAHAAAAYRSIVRTAVATHGGWEIAREGDRIMAGFLAPTEAVACAVAIHRACVWHNRGTTDRLDIRIGVQVGETDGPWRSRRDGSLPSPAVQAGRLGDAAGGGRILVSELVSSLAHPRGVTFERNGLLDTGTGAPSMSTFEVRLTAPLAAPVQLPARLLDHSRRTPFVGRHAERDRLHAAWTSAAAGERRLAVVTGEPGAGKSRLAMEFASGIHAEGGLAMWGRSFEEAVLPYQPFVEMLSQYFTGADPQELGWVPQAVRRQLARLVPEACVRGGTGAVGVSEDDRPRLFEAVSSFMSGVSIGSPVLLILDDLQWADPASLLLLKSLMLDRRAASLMVLGIFRDTDVPPSHPLARVLADIERERYIDHITLGGLDVSDVAEMLRTAFPSTIPPDLAPSVWEDTAGNPFFAEELIWHMEALMTASDQPIAGPPRLAIQALGVPRRLRDRLGRRLQRLSAPTLEALAAAAVIGPRFGLDVLGQVLSTDQPQLVAMMDEAVRARLVTEVADRAGRYGFRHPIVRRALYEHHTANQRGLIHARAAKALHRRGTEHGTATPRLRRQRLRAVGSSSDDVRRGPTPTIAALLGGAPDAQHTPAPAVVASR